MKRYVIAALVCFSLAVSASAFATEWTVPGSFPTIQAAISSTSVVKGDVILVSGTQKGALVTKSVEIRGVGDAVINDGPVHGSGLIMGFRLQTGSDGSTISHLTFTVDFPIMNGGFDNAGTAGIDDVTVVQNRFLNSNQAVSNWGGKGWDISHNEIIDLRCANGGGIGILIGDFSGGAHVQENLVSHNKISGTLHVNSYADRQELGGYSGSGIVIYADFRGGRLGASELSYNRVIKNKVDLVSDDPDLVDVNAFELTEGRDEADTAPHAVVIRDNAIGFNDFRGTDPDHQVILTPTNLDSWNTISRNFGENRGHELSPKLFGPAR